MPLRRLFEAPTLTGLAASVDEEVCTAARMVCDRASRRAIRAPEPRTASAQGDGGSMLPLSFAQQRLWFLDRLEPGSALYNLPTAMRFEGALNIDALQQALSARSSGATRCCARRSTQSTASRYSSSIRPKPPTRSAGWS